jgi:hypothetical protein
VPTDARIEPRTVATGALAVRRSNQEARSHPQNIAKYMHHKPVEIYPEFSVNILGVRIVTFLRHGRGQNF